MKKCKNKTESHYRYFRTSQYVTPATITPIKAPLNNFGFDFRLDDGTFTELSDIVVEGIIVTGEIINAVL